MKILNIILCIFIFLLAAASAVFSYFLFEKRSQFVSSHQKMAAEISSVSSKLISGSKNATTPLNESALAHDQHDKLDSLLPNLSSQADNLITQRNTMADGFIGIANALSMGNVPAVAELQDMDTYKSHLPRIEESAHHVTASRNKMNMALITFASKYKINITDFISRPEEELKKIGEYITSIQEINDEYRKALRLAFSSADGRAKVLASSEISAAVRKRDIDTILKHIRSRIAQIKAIQRQLAAEKGISAGLRREVARGKSNLEKQMRNMNRISGELQRLKRHIGVSDTFQPWGDGSIEARSRMIGKITGVSKEYGYMVVDLGSRSVVYQLDRNGTRRPVPIKLDDTVEVIVVRGNEKNSDPNVWLKPDGAVQDSTVLAANDQFVTASRVRRVGEKESVIELPAGADVRIGDIVLFKYPAK